MHYLILYDIEENKIRSALAKRIERYGGVRIQKSVFLLETTERKKCALAEELEEVQSTYPNQDTILILPIDKDHLKATVSIGTNPAFDQWWDENNTFFV